MAKNQPEVKEVKLVTLESGEIVTVVVYEEKESKRPRKVKTRGKQTSDASLIGGWGHSCFKNPGC